MALADRVKGIKQSPTLSILAKAKELKKKGINVLDFSVGEPDFDTPQNIKDAAIKALKDGFTKYTAPAGIPELRTAIADKLKKENKVDCTPSQIIVSDGAKHSLNNIFQVLCQKGDEVLVPAPYWPSFVQQVKLSDATPKIIQCDNLKLSAEKLLENISPKTKALIINSPNNPSSVVYAKNELKKIAEVCVEKNIYVISDEIYEKLVYDEEHYSIASFGQEIRDKTITVNGFSKTYSMTGWRVGYACANDEIIHAIDCLQGNACGNTTSIAQKGALEALLGPQDSVKKMAGEFKKRRDQIEKGLSKVNGFSCPKPMGAFYAFPNVLGAFNKKFSNSTEFCNFLLEELNIATVPGNEFGKEGHMRFSFATSLQTIIQGVEKLQNYF